MRSGFLLNLILVLALALGGASIWREAWMHQASAGSAVASTVRTQGDVDDAEGVRAEGQLVTYADAEVTVGSEVPGLVKTLAVKENDSVGKGDLIAEIDSRQARAQLAEAHARIQEAEANIVYLTSELNRMQNLLNSHAVSRENYDRAARDLAEATARRDEAAADADSLSLLVEKTRIVAPIGGVVIKRFVEQGQTVAAEASIVRIADMHRTRVQAEVDEFDVGRVALGAPARITVEGYEGRMWRGRVEEIPQDVVGRALRPEDPGSPTDTRVLMVKIGLLEPTPIKLGQRVEVEILPPTGTASANFHASHLSRSQPGHGKTLAGSKTG
jgi:HlyD family secretion protein